jgi:hypothetical protein
MFIFGDGLEKLSLLSVPGSTAAKIVGASLSLLMQLDLVSIHEQLMFRSFPKFRIERVSNSDGAR